ncbi:MAG: flagellar protein FlaG [Desulfobulbaceae bacterium]|nr:flagellar protein FlaG [Desulfobulbaceae bacterium]
MDVNVTTDVKGYGVPAAPAVELEDAQKPAVQPVQESSDGSTVELNDQALHGKGKKEKESKKFTQEDIEEAVEEIQGKLETMGSSFKFGLYEHLETESIVGQIRDKETGEVVKQFPSEEILELREKLQDLIGLLFDKKV